MLAGRSTENRDVLLASACSVDQDRSVGVLMTEKMVLRWPLERQWVALLTSSSEQHSSAP